EHSHNRYDMIVADPAVTLLTRGLQTEIQAQNQPAQFSEKDPFALLQQYMEQYQITEFSDETLPFQGGAMGIWSYDLGRRIEKLPELATTELQFPDMAVGIYLWALIVDHHE